MTDNEPRQQKPDITYDAFNQVDVRLCRIVEVTPLLQKQKLPPGDDNPVKAYKLLIDTGVDERECVTNLVEYTPEELKGLTLPFVLNLPPQQIRGVHSRAMIIAIAGANGKSVLLLSKDDVGCAGMVIV